jgi:hypothetical protein
MRFSCAEQLTSVALGGDLYEGWCRSHRRCRLEHDAVGWLRWCVHPDSLVHPEAGRRHGVQPPSLVRLDTPRSAQPRGPAWQLRGSRGRDAFQPRRIDATHRTWHRRGRDGTVAEAARQRCGSDTVPACFRWTIGALFGRLSHRGRWQRMRRADAAVIPAGIRPHSNCGVSRRG